MTSRTLAEDCDEDNMEDNITASLVLKIIFTYSVFLGLQVRSGFAENDNVFLPTPKLKTLQPRITTPTPLPVTEGNLWGIRLWQVVGLAFVATILLIIFCCCLCDCRIPKTAYDKHDKLEEGSDCSDTEPAAAVRGTPQVPQGGKKLANSPAPQKGQIRTTGQEMGRENNAFDDDGEITAKHSETWKGTPRVTFSRQP